MTVAKIILNQIKTIDIRALWAWGAKDMVDTGNGLKFKSSGLCRWKGHINVKYNNGTDLYDIEFFRIRAGNIKIDKVETDVYAEDLVRVIDSQVG